MDTPEKATQICAPLSKFEDSPVFNYINSLSPIKPVKSMHISQGFQSLTFASLPSIFSSPHVCTNKESRFLKRHNYGEASKGEISSEDANTLFPNEGITGEGSQLHERLPEIQENFDSATCLEAASPTSHDGSLNPVVELPQTLRYDCGSPNCDPALRATNMDPLPVSSGTLEALTPSTDETSPAGLLECEENLRPLYTTESTKENTECDWENLMLDTADLLIFNSPMDSEAFRGLTQKSPSGAVLRCSLNEEDRFRSVTFADDAEAEDQNTQPGEKLGLQQTNQIQEDLAHVVGLPNLSTRQVVSNLHRGMRRRCLDFEMLGARRKNLIYSSGSSSTMSLQSDGHIASENKQLVPFKSSTDHPRSILPGIGLHLNSLAITSNDSNNIKHEGPTAVTSFSDSVSSLQSPTTDQEINKSLNLAITSITNIDPLLEDASQQSAYVTPEEPNPTSPKKKRRKLEGEGDSCKRCNCKKSKCLKLYCECFAAGVYCIEPCSCHDCFNKPIHEDSVLATRKQIESRNPLAFAPKVVRGEGSVAEVGDDFSKTPASARHKRGCNCKKSNCLKKYCECFQGGVGCSIGCRCEGCKNTFGIKDGSAPVESEAGGDDEAEASETVGADNAMQKNEVHNEEEQNPNSGIPMTPMSLCRTLIPLQLSSKSKPPRSLLGIGSSSSGLYAGPLYGKPNIIISQSKQQFQAVLPDDEIPDILRVNFSPSTSIKTLSPNSKRVSPPQNNFGSSPGLRSGRKLILQSIPSFPSLTPQR